MISLLKTLTSSELDTTGFASDSVLPWTSWLLLLLGHGALLVVVYSVLYTVGLLDYAPNEQGMVVWDAGWFNSVRDHGYDTLKTGQSNIPFFPLFPYLWRLLGVGGLGISIVNFGLFLLGAAWLGRTFALRRGQVLLLLSVPSAFICCVPYAEALFFLFGAVLLCGLHRRHLGLTLLGLLGCCLTRSAATLFVPAFVLAEVLACTARPDLLRTAVRIGAGLFAIAAALGIVFYMHYLATGDPLVFFAAHEQWGHKIQWPLKSLMHSSAGTIVLWLDAMALLTGGIAAVSCIGLSIRWLWGWLRKGPAPTAPSRGIVFSLGYCLAATCFILLYQNGDLVGISRYILATPFWGALLSLLPHWRKLPVRGQWMAGGVVAALALGVAFWLGWPLHFPGFVPAQAHWFLAVWVFYLLLYLLAAPGIYRYGREVQAGLYVINVVYQAFLLNLFIGKVWLG